MGIPVSGPLWGLRWMLTVAQAELMAMDIPVVDYHGKGQDGTHGGQTAGGGGRTFGSPSRKALESAASEWKEKYGENGEQLKEKLKFDKLWQI